MKTIFFLDDSTDFLMLAQMFVEATCDSKAITCDSYENALLNEPSILASDMAFLDINLGPRKPSGIDVYRWLQTKGYKKPIYFLTGHGKESPEAQAAEALGGASLLTKPLPNQELRRIILQ
jgi:FixJ family two-component response regulator